MSPHLNRFRQVSNRSLATASAAVKRLQAEHSSEAVHTYRISMKRWRAFLKLIRKPIGEEAVTLRREALQLSRELSGSRDAQAALDAFRDLVVSKAIRRSSISKIAQNSIIGRLEGLRLTSHENEIAARTIQKLYAGIARASDVASAWPLEKITEGQIGSALAASYRRARGRFRHNRKTMSANDVHAIRKSLVTFRYELDIVKPLWPKVWKTFIDGVNRSRALLGLSNDLVTLSQYTAPNQPLARWRSRLKNPIESRRRFFLQEGTREIQFVLSMSPRVFRSRLK